MMDLTPDEGVMAELARGADFDHPSCQHEGTNFTVTRKGAVICFECYAATFEQDRIERREAVPQNLALCFNCQDIKQTRKNPDNELDFCDECHMQLVNQLIEFDAVHVPTKEDVPDELSPSVLYISSKDGQYRRETLARLGITRVLICCDVLRAYHHPHDTSLLYHRLPLQDSLAQHLTSYLPSAMAFIAQGALKGERTLVHCNAGRSRSGIITCEWLRRTVPAIGGDLDLALAEAKKRRPLIEPNSNFMQQIRDSLSAAHADSSASEATSSSSSSSDATSSSLPS